MAHTLVGFGFDDGQFLCVSVVARQRWQSYFPLWGLFRSYELMFVLGDKRDIVRLRTNIRREQVYMYRLRMPPQNLRRLILDYVRRIEILAAQPDWYNSVTSNCTTNLFYNRRASVPWWLKPNIFLNRLKPRDVSTRLLGQQFAVPRIANTLRNSRAGPGRPQCCRFLSANSRQIVCRSPNWTIMDSTILHLIGWCLEAWRVGEASPTSAASPTALPRGSRRTVGPGAARVMKRWCLPWCRAGFDTRVFVANDRTTVRATDLPYPPLSAGGPGWRVENLGFAGANHALAFRSICCAVGPPLTPA